MTVAGLSGIQLLEIPALDPLEPVALALVVVGGVVTPLPALFSARPDMSVGSTVSPTVPTFTSTTASVCVLMFLASTVTFTVCAATAASRPAKKPAKGR